MNSGAFPEAIAAKLAKLGVRARFDLVLHLPSRYEDETRLTPVNAAPAGTPVLVEATLERAEIAYRPRRQLIVRTNAGGEPLALRFFNFYPGQLKQFERARQQGLLVRAFGELRGGRSGAEMAHPRYRLAAPGDPLPDSLTPVYPTTAGMAQATLRKLIRAAIEELPLEDTLPPEIRERYALEPFDAAVRLLHLPPPGADVAALAGRTHPAWRRVKFDELFAQQLSMRMHYRARHERRAPSFPAGGALTRRFLAALPFRLTRAQERCLAEIRRDLGERHPMQRLLQGDVGSGKTILAAIGCLAAVDAGWQAVVMAPTELLAEQHQRKFSEWLAPLGVRIAWLHGALGRKEKRAAIAAIGTGEAQIAIGTHALFQQGVAFAQLGLAVVDEQHRFGVQQRLQLRRKGEAANNGLVPHQLMMSATPIPRTLSMTYYADLEVSTIDEMPPGRQPVKTRLVADARRGEVLLRIRAACRAGQQAYWVCPLVEESAKLDLQAALDAHAELKGELPELSVGLLHGRMAPAEKAGVMREFLARRVQLLVATTVIEVGVDVPNASLMVIEHAERFGLSQLHQLRGRVGRGAVESVCILLYRNPLSAAARARLKVIFETADGFEVARQDLLLRGPGEYLGERQSGAPLLRFADLERDQSLIAAAREAAAGMLERQPAAARAHVERWLAARQDFARV